MKKKLLVIVFAIAFMLSGFQRLAQAQATCMHYTYRTIFLFCVYDVTMTTCCNAGSCTTDYSSEIVLCDFSLID